MAQVPVVSSGRVERLSDYPSKFISVRNIDIWLPEGYPAAGKYDVIYMHDGQMLFDSSTTWNHLDWGVDEEVSSLIKEKKIRSCIVVAIWNAGQGRHADYFPEKPYRSLPLNERQKIDSSVRADGSSVFNGIAVASDKYLQFMVSELKPFIDKKYQTYTEPAHTYIAGSSMGGLISIYALCEYPDVFGGAACISTHWPGIFTIDNNPFLAAMFTYLNTHLPDPLTHRIYFDHGTETLDALYAPFQVVADSIMKIRGYADSNWMTKVFPGEEHSEKAWRNRISIPLSFLLQQ